MKVYILECENSHDNPLNVFVGVFSSMDKANEFTKKNAKELFSGFSPTNVKYTITEREIDVVTINDINTGNDYARTRVGFSE